MLMNLQQPGTGVLTPDDVADDNRGCHWDMFGKYVCNLNLQNLADTQSQYVAFGPSAGEGMRVDIGDAMTDTAIAGNAAYNAYARSQGGIDALWKLIDPKGHAKNADKTFATIYAVGDIVNASGAW